MTPTFTPVRFDALNLPTILRSCREQGIEEYRSVAVAFGLWQRAFARKAFLFYQAQYRHHYYHVWDEFARQHQITQGDTLPEWLEYAWAQRRTDTALDEHWQFVQEQHDVLARFEMQHLSDSYGTPARVIQHAPINFDAVWFNSTIQPSQTQRQALAALPYDVYLTTQHWRRVRAAVLLLFGGVCQGVDCPAQGESWFGDESAVQVHHANYQRVGCERYGDVTLLCRQCHDTRHLARV